MYKRQYKTRKTSSKSSETPASSPLELRRFVVQPQSPTPDLQNQEDELAQSDNLLRNISILRTDDQRSPIPIQMKLAIGQPGDKYEQEADRVAADVIKRINAPKSTQIQREATEDEDELQMKPLTETIQRLEATEDEDELQMKSIVQRRSNMSDMAATPDLEESIQRLQGSGQSLANNIREPMEQAFGADFSGVKIHRDSQSHQLNQSIQAKAFTTGQDIFFREGAYNPGSREGQELIAHELTHVVQQSSGVVQHKRDTITKQSAINPVVQRDWDNNKCPNGGPDKFDPDEALDAAPNIKPAYIHVHKTPRAKWDYTIAHYYLVKVEINHVEWQVCVVVHAHIYGQDPATGKLAPGSCYIPGWNGWEVQTPLSNFLTHFTMTKNSLAKLKPHEQATTFGFEIMGTFPGEDRYPQLTAKGKSDLMLDAFL